MILIKGFLSHTTAGFSPERGVRARNQQIEIPVKLETRERAVFQAAPAPGRTRIITSTRLISVPAGGIGRLVTVRSSPGMSCSLPVTSQKKWWWSEVLVSKYD